MKGIVIENSANLYKVINPESKEIYSCLARGILKNIGISPVVGDRVEFSDKENVIEKIYDRDNYIKRPKIANITQIVFIISMKNPKPDLLLLDKQLAFASQLGVKSLIAINKCDLVDEKEVQSISQIYDKIGYKVIKIKAKEKMGIQELSDNLKGEVSVLAGNSGVGKSTIINALFNDLITEEGEISKKNKKGKNTTTLVRLYELDPNTFVADAPGFSTFDIYEIEKEDLAHYFIEFAEYMKDCSYVGCSHINESEKECKVKQAYLEGNISNSRYNNYCKIYEELKNFKKW